MNSRLALVALATLAIAGAATREYALAAKSTEAAPAAPAPAPVSSEPQATTASFGDWVVRCVVVQGTPAKRSCEASLSLLVQYQGRQLPLAQVAFGRTGDAGSPLQLTAQLPVNVSFDKPVGIGSDDAHLTTLSFRRCVAAGCYASTQPTSELLTALRTATKPGRLVFTDAGERTLTLPLSTRGLAQALDNLGKDH